MTQLKETHQKSIRNDLEHEILRVKISISTLKSEKFVDELEKLCKKFSIEGDYFFAFK